ncbi:hypothetical protein L7F22_017286 [Adiantum nelumboides]|nr:hypothetical protein [Adiantum nelumboides]
MTWRPIGGRTLNLRHIPAASLYVSRPTWWLESRFHFSFAEYYNPKRSEFGNLRVVNDDLVQPHSGFGTHPHKDMEIFTYVIDGELTHKDSMGAHESLGRGGVQYMSAGLGVTHSEMNNGDKLLRFLQIWIKPDRKHYKPNYGSRVFMREDRHNKLHHVVTSYKNYINTEKDEGVGIIPIHQDANIYIAELDKDFTQEFILQRRRQLYLVCIEGSLCVNKTVSMDERDALEVVGDDQDDLPLELTATGNAGGHFILLEMVKA